MMSQKLLSGIAIAAALLAPLHSMTGATVTLELEESSDLQNWERVPILPSALTADGKIVHETSGGKGFYRLRIRSADPPPGMVLVPGGSFAMGDHFHEGWEGETPVHAVTLSTFYMDETPVSWTKWQEIRNWALDHGYTLSFGSGQDDTHPVFGRGSWHEAVKWCNAKSEREGLTPVYYTDDARTEVYRSGKHDVSAEQVKWEADGYRLPTEAEWEYAARGGLEGRRFPWGNSISHADANYDDGNSYHPDFDTGDFNFPYTSPVASFAANDYGLYDMAGNVWEWCWDWYDENYYSESAPTNPTGPSSGSTRVLRGGSWSTTEVRCRVAARFFDWPAQEGLPGVRSGFRTVRRP